MEFPLEAAGINLKSRLKAELQTLSSFTLNLEIGRGGTGRPAREVTLKMRVPQLQHL